MSKRSILTFIAVLALSSLLMVEVAPASAQNKPSVPEFTLKFVPSLYNVTTTDPYTGDNVTEQINNNTINIVIKNPVAYSFSSRNYYLFYNVRVKGHFSEVWEQLYYDYSNFSYSRYSEYKPNWLAADENSEYTTISYPANYQPRSELDFQVEAITMYDGQVKVYSNLYDFTGHFESGYVLGERSGWSGTQTITIEEVQTPSPTSTPEPPSTPTSTPYTEPQSAEQGLILGVAITVAVIGAGLSLLVYLIKRK